MVKWWLAAAAVVMSAPAAYAGDVVVSVSGAPPEAIAGGTVSFPAVTEQTFTIEKDDDGQLVVFIPDQTLIDAGGAGVVTITFNDGRPAVEGVPITISGGRGVVTIDEPAPAQGQDAPLSQVYPALLNEPGQFSVTGSIGVQSAQTLGEVLSGVSGSGGEEQLVGLSDDRLTLVGGEIAVGYQLTDSVNVYGRFDYYEGDDSETVDFDGVDGAPTGLTFASESEEFGTGLLLGSGDPLASQRDVEHEQYSVALGGAYQLDGDSVRYNVSNADVIELRGEIGYRSGETTIDDDTTLLAFESDFADAFPVQQITNAQFEADQYYVDLGVRKHYALDSVSNLSVHTGFGAEIGLIETEAAVDQWTIAPAGLLGEGPVNIASRFEDDSSNGYIAPYLEVGASYAITDTVSVVATLQGRYDAQVRYESALTDDGVVYDSTVEREFVGGAAFGLSVTF